MELKHYETPEVDLLQINTEVNFCTSGALDDFSTQDPGPGFFEAPAIF